MGLLQKAVETYDSMNHLAGIIENGKEPLAPIGHICTKAAIEITIDKNGNYIHAKKTENKIIIPVTEKSAGRSGTNPRPHPLCDQIKYIVAENGKTQAYLAQLKAWCDFSYNTKLAAIYNYVSKGCIKSDLKRAGLLLLDENGSIKNEKDMICWRVTGISDEDSAVWTDKSIQNSFIDFYANQNKEAKENISYISGKRDIIVADLSV